MSDEWGAGDPSKWSDHGTVVVGNQEYPLIYGEHPHSRRDNHHYVRMKYSKEPVAFDGHQPLISVFCESENYLKQSELSGDEVRRGGTAKIICDGIVVWEFFFRDVQVALLEAHQLITQLSQHESFWLMKRERDQLVGRKIFYREVPAVIRSLICDQGCIMIATADGKPFPPPVYAEDPDDDERESVMKVEVLSPHIWWFRE